MLKKFEIRWGDLDANRHVANTSYVSFMNETRMGFFAGRGFGQAFFEQHNIGPVIFNEEHHYVREIHHGETVQADLELLGSTEDFKFVRIAHCLFNGEGKLASYSEVLFGWMDLTARKLVPPPAELRAALQSAPRSEHFAFFSEAETRSAKVPKRTLGEKK